MRRIFRSIVVILLLATYGNADDIDLEVHNGLMLKMLRDMTNKTNASESLNLPANASSIRENITDTFSCENRTYGYYADVDNDCQIFHVCLPSQTPSGRNVTYRWSFICPNETIFNQAVLTCTRPFDSIPCEESPDFYDINNELGKVPPKNDSKKIDKDTRHALPNEKDRKQFQYNNRNNVQYNIGEDEDQIERERQGVGYRVPQKRRQDNRKQNLILDKLFTEIVDEELKEKLENTELGENVEEIFPEVITDEVLENRPQFPKYTEEITMSDEDVEGRLVLERNVGGRRFRFKSDV